MRVWIFFSRKYGKALRSLLDQNKSVLRVNNLCLVVVRLVICE